MFFTFGETSASERKLSLGTRGFLAMDGQLESPPNPAPGLPPGRGASQADLCGLIQDN